MKDLYRCNGLRPRESDNVKIHGASGSAEEREAAFSILLNAHRKREYDAAHLALSRIGYLRRHMGLGGRHNWRRLYGEFLEPDVMEQNSSQPASAKPRLPWRLILGWLLIATVVVAATTPLAYLVITGFEHLARP